MPSSEVSSILTQRLRSRFASLLECTADSLDLTQVDPLFCATNIQRLVLSRLQIEVLSVLASKGSVEGPCPGVESSEDETFSKCVTALDEISAEESSAIGILVSNTRKLLEDLDKVKSGDVSVSAEAAFLTEHGRSTLKPDAEVPAAAVPAESTEGSESPVPASRARSSTLSRARALSDRITTVKQESENHTITVTGSSPRESGEGMDHSPLFRRRSAGSAFSDAGEEISRRKSRDKDANDPLQDALNKLQKTVKDVKRRSSSAHKSRSPFASSVDGSSPSHSPHRLSPSPRGKFRHHHVRTSSREIGLQTQIVEEGNGSPVVVESAAADEDFAAHFDAQFGESSSSQASNPFSAFEDTKSASTNPPAEVPVEEPNASAAAEVVAETPKRSLLNSLMEAESSETASSTSMPAKSKVPVEDSAAETPVEKSTGDDDGPATKDEEKKDEDVAAAAAAVTEETPKRSALSGLLKAEGGGEEAAEVTPKRSAIQDLLRRETPNSIADSTPKRSALNSLLNKEASTPADDTPKRTALQDLLSKEGASTETPPKRSALNQLLSNEPPSTPSNSTATPKRSALQELLNTPTTAPESTPKRSALQSLLNPEGAGSTPSRSQVPPQEAASSLPPASAAGSAGTETAAAQSSTQPEAPAQRVQNPSEVRERQNGSTIEDVERREAALREAELRSKRRESYERDVLRDKYVDMLSAGAQFTKYALKGKPHPRFVWLNRHQMCIYWNESLRTEQTKFRIRMRDVFDVREGATTETFLKKRKASARGYCFSLMTSDRTLDLETNSEDERNLWVEALSFLLKDMQQESAMF